MSGPQVARYDTAGGRRIYRLPVEIFPRLFGNCYLVTGGRRPLLVDCGSGQESSDRDLAAGFEAVRARFGEAVQPAELGAILLTHGHIDHFGGLAAVRRQSRAPVGIHVLDRRVLSHYEERLLVASRQVEAFLETTGLGEERRAQYMAMYRSMKGLFRSQEVDFLLAEGAVLGGELEALHAPGHCPGQLCLKVDDVLLTADHLLPKISPHIAPEAITASTGFGHYFESLRRLAAIDGVRLGLGGHGGPIDDVAARCCEIRRLHEARQARLIELCSEPRRIVSLSRELFGPVKSYHVLLAILETGAHVEYLYQRGELVVANLDELESGAERALAYRAP